MKIEILSTGTELLSGKVNTDDAYLCEKLTGIGLTVTLLITVGDSKDELKTAFEESLKRADMVFTVGGLGPTFDDLTREVVAGALKSKLVFNKEVMHQIAAHFARRDLEMPANNDRQAYIIKGARVILNKTGTAPGMIVEAGEGNEKKLVIMLPGPPRELAPMMEGHVIPFLRGRYEKNIAKTSVLHVCGLVESAVFEKIKDIVEIEREMEGNILTFALLASSSVINVKITGKGDNELLIDNMMHKARREIYNCLGNDIYGEDNDTLEGVVGRLMGRKRKSLCVAESCTGGLIANRITNVSGSSVYFKQGIVSYSNESKVRMLKVKEDTIKKYGAVSEHTAKEMAVGARLSCDADLGLATTGIAGPSGGAKKKPVGLVYIALANGDDVFCKEYRFAGNRLAIKERVAVTALDMLRRTLH